jgi:hypothetical protein
MKITKETRQEMADILEQRHVSEKTAQDIILMCKNGLTAREALKMRGIDNPNKDTLTNLKKKSERVLLANPQLQKLAHNAVRDILKMKPVEVNVSPDSDKKRYIYPTVSNRLAAAAMVTDRTEPIVQEIHHHKTSIHADIDFSEFRKPKPVPQDIEVRHISDEALPVECNNIKELQE